MIDLRSKPDPGPAIAFAAKARDHRVVVVAELPRDAVEVEGHHYVGKVGVTTDPERIPPPRPRPKRPEPTLAEVRSQRTADLQQQIRDHVDTLLPTSEREALAALMQKTTLMRMVGAPVDEGASLALVMSLGWAEQAMIMGDDAAQACARADTIEALQAITVDLDKLGAPPKITAGEIAKALRSNP